MSEIINSLFPIDEGMSAGREYLQYPDGSHGQRAYELLEQELTVQEVETVFRVHENRWTRPDVSAMRLAMQVCRLDEVDPTHSAEGVIQDLLSEAGLWLNWHDLLSRHPEIPVLQPDIDPDMPDATTFYWAVIRNTTELEVLARRFLYDVQKLNGYLEGSPDDLQLYTQTTLHHIAVDFSRNGKDRYDH